jgi:GAF domain-containing protein
LEKEGFITVVSIPLVAQEKVLGAINVASRTLGKPKPEELAVPAAIGQQIGVAIDNSRLYAQSVEYANQMELARQAADTANASKSNFLANVSPFYLVSMWGLHVVQKRLEGHLPLTTNSN